MEMFVATPVPEAIKNLMFRNISNHVVPTFHELEPHKDLDTDKVSLALSADPFFRSRQSLASLSLCRGRDWAAHRLRPDCLHYCDRIVPPHRTRGRCSTHTSGQSHGRLRTCDDREIHTSRPLGGAWLSGCDLRGWTASVSVYPSPL